MEPGSLLKSAARQQEVMVVNPNWGVSSQKQVRESSNMIISMRRGYFRRLKSVECLKTRLYQVESSNPVRMQRSLCCEREAGETSWASSSLDEAVTGILPRQAESLSFTCYMEM